MKRLLSLFFLLSLCVAQTFAQSVQPQPFKGYIYNKEYEVYIRMNFYENNMQVPGQEVYGEMPGFFGDIHDGRKWLILETDVKDSVAILQIVNDEGSEDLQAKLTAYADSTFVLEQTEGSTIKIARKRKWVKMPRKLVFKRQ